MPKIPERTRVFLTRHEVAPESRKTGKQKRAVLEAETEEIKQYGFSPHALGPFLPNKKLIEEAANPEKIPRKTKVILNKVPSYQQFLEKEYPHWVARKIVELSDPEIINRFNSLVRDWNDNLSKGVEVSGERLEKARKILALVDELFSS